MILYYHHPPKAADGIMNFACVLFGLFLFHPRSIEHHVPVLGLCELEEEDGQDFRHQQQAGAP